MERFLWYPLEHLPFIVLVIMIVFTVHEFAHAYSAYKFGDDTAYKEGRVTLNPMVHLDLMGSILLLIAGFGWAKPVPVNASRFKHRRVMSIVVSAVGPLSNLLMAVVGMFIIYGLVASGVVHVASTGVQDALIVFFSYFIMINILLFVFNLIPLPPLDGYRIVSEFLPLRLRYKIEQNIHWAMILFLLFVFIPPLRAVTLDPILSLQYPLFNGLNDLMQSIFGFRIWLPR
ncbi:site-2 protease family protein [Paenibacillus sp. MY03]|jgi:Zn-dependent protease|uniref:Site-2 protease family protein n=1 Tax=Paenibacillus agaridevorans TaxID=171404 RepID=A0A2R5F5R5_9BACL|nr:MULTISPECIES: site-2 protease family protein [Paenibacillus]OUS77537.1 site-2 protease family protein [Paenibacillus sp. MY03]GBG12203.1 site-2 protease family protein [Paenibacillus agaridevorans]